MATNPARLFLKRSKTVLLICDVQTKSSKAAYESDKMVTNAAKLISACKLLDVPMIVTEQYPAALGPTVSQFDISGANGPFPKMQFSMCVPEVKETLSKICSGGPPETMLLVGQEAHVCVEMTAMELRKEGFTVRPVIDCISSRSAQDRFYALERMNKIGCVLSTSEDVLFKLLGSADDAHFKNILKLYDHLSCQIGRLV